MDLKELSKFYNINMEDLKEMPYNKLESMVNEMVKKNENVKNDEKYRNIIKSCFEPFDYLNTWFSEDEIIEACAKTYPMIDDFLEKEQIGDVHFVAKQLQGCVVVDAIYDNPHYVAKRLQGHIVMDIVENLLYTRYPQLRKFNFFTIQLNQNDYAVMQHGVYIPFDALMNKDIITIIVRNVKLSNEHALYSNEAKHLLDVIKNL